jgi:superfamily II DNA/RNA helicase
VSPPIQSTRATPSLFACVGTGTGKTLAFSLPIVERLQRDMRPVWGRPPRCLVFEPTRELAKQVTDDFLSIKSRALAITTLYGGKQYAEQENSLKRGSDVVVGTPGRVKDFLHQKKLNLGHCQTIVLDEVDRMLDMGFQVRERHDGRPDTRGTHSSRTMWTRSFNKCRTAAKRRR